MVMPPLHNENSILEARPSSGDHDAVRLRQLRELRVEVQELHSILESVRNGETTLDSYVGYIQQTNKDISELLAQIKNGDSVRILQNIWEQMSSNPLMTNPEIELSAREQLHHLNMLENRIRKLIFQVGALTIPARVNDWLGQARPGYYIPFHLVFEDEVPAYEDRVRILQYLAWSPKALRGGLVDAAAGVIYRYAENPRDRVSSAVLLLLGFGLATGTVVASSLLPIPEWPIQRDDLATLAVGWVATLLGVVTHMAVGTVKRNRSTGGLPPNIAVRDFLLMVDARLGPMLFKLLLALIGFFGFVFTTGLENVEALDTLMVGYTLDSVVELFGTGIEQRAAAQEAVLRRQLGVVDE